ncbi:TIGR03617 family F420-dependent LLM class oxidoreductase [Dactylosporangium sucinum]|uniref:LLM class F420-dependent oxidoreductase n=1 Tax=Dactylosporangium sucinum TaxID=1424081 RepID=A0A917U8C9_9ACTN|nr:TIGR03617 family F420-dependent LLM class oxidoreductase [Dactylosporangium sucinum]GGM64688.1 LLM class F420-dependent oxidoreductase [Dactylosporangium sucinum]
MIVDIAAADDAGRLPDIAQAAEHDGYDGVWVGETRHDVFLQCLRAVSATGRIQVGSGIAIAFARSPMTVAYQANDLQLASRGRFVLGLGTQVRAHVERRFAMPWGAPAARARDYVAAVRSVWHSWATGDKLDFRGDFYQLTLMNEFFSPGPNPHGPPPIYLAAVGDGLTRVAGEVADGLVAHAFSTSGYLREHTLPIASEGFTKAGRGRENFVLSATVTVATGTSDEEIALAVRAARKRIAFYGSTPAYRGVLAHHGWGDLAEDLAAEARQVDDPDRWETMTAMIDDEVLNAFAVCGAVDDVAKEIVTRYRGVADRVTLYAQGDAAQPHLVTIARALQRKGTS